MQRLSKRFLALLLALFTLVALLPVSVMAEETTTIVGQQLYLGDDLTMHFYGDIAQSHKADAVATITVAGEEVCSYTVNQMTAGKNGLYDFSVELAAAQMTDTIVVSITSGNAEVFSKNYSVLDYLVYLLNGAYTADTKQLVKELLNYGAAAQTYFEYNTDALANTGYQIEATAAIPTEAPAIDLSGKVSGASFYGASMLFRSKIAVRFYFTVESSLEGYDVSIPDNSFTVGQKDNLYYIEVADIMPQDMETALNLTVTKGEESLTISYSPMTYIVRMYNNANTSANLKALLVAANSYFAAAKNTVVAMDPVLNDFSDRSSIQITYTDAWNGNKTSKPELTAEGNLNFWIAQWTKSGSLQLYIPIQKSKSEIKSLLDAGYDEFTLKLDQSYMTDSPWWGLTNKISADWTAATYSVAHDAGFQTLTFSLQDLYDNYDALADGTMALLKFSIVGLDANDGGVWDGSAWVSSSYNIIIGDFVATNICKHNADSEWDGDETNHWHNCTECGEALNSAAHTVGNWIPTEETHYKVCAECGMTLNESAHNWQILIGGRKCLDCGYEDTLPYIFNDYSDRTGVKITYVDAWNGQKTAAPELTAEGNANHWIAAWTKANSLKFYMPMNLSKEDVKALLDSGCTEIEVTLYQSAMNETPWWSLTNKVSADWTDATYSVSGSWKTMYFDLQDLYDNYDALADGTMPLLKFDIDGLADNDGGVWVENGNPQWTSSSYNVIIAPVKVVNYCRHTSVTDWETDGENHWKTCNDCGEKLENGAHSLSWTSDETSHYQSCAVCGLKQNEGAHNMETVTGGQKCSDCGYEQMIPYVINDFNELTGVKITYINSGNQNRFSTPTLSGEGIANFGIDAWTKANSLKLYVPLELSKDEVKALLDMGCTEFEITLKQSYMNQDPWWGLTNKVSADWTSATYSVAHTEGYKTMTFSLQDLYDNYDAIADGTMPLLKFAIAGQDNNDGGFWVDGKGWISSDYNIFIKAIAVKIP